MKHLIAVLTLAATPAFADQQVVPSGFELSLFDAFVEQPNNLWRFRYQTDGLRLENYADVSADFLHLCQEYILPTLTAKNQVPDQIVISIADREVPFGVTDPGTGTFLGDVASLSAAESIRAVDAAQAAFASCPRVSLAYSHGDHPTGRSRR